MATSKIKKGDTVRVIAGKDKEVCGKIPAKNKNAGYTQKLFKKILNDIHMGIGYEWIYLSI